MARRYGRSPIGQRLACPIPQGYYQTTTMIAAVRLKGPQAPWLFGGAIDGELFLAWVKPGLAPRRARQRHQAAGTAFDAVIPADGQGFFLHAGYAK